VISQGDQGVQGERAGKHHREIWEVRENTDKIEKHRN
jgi:hypothetical protein